MDPASFATEHRRLTQAIADSIAIEQRLQQEVDYGNAKATETGAFPPGHAETQWLLTRSKDATIKLRNQLDRVVQRQRDALVMTLLARLRERFPREVAKLEQQAAAEFGLETAPRGDA